MTPGESCFPGRTRRLVIALSLSGCGILAAGCSLAPDYAPPTLAVAPSYKEASPWAPAQPSDAAPRSNWWTLFQDPVLDDLEGQVTSANPTLAAALAAYEQARAFAAQANADLVPTVTAIGSPTYNRQSDHRPLRGANQPDQYTNNSLGAQIDYEFDFWGRVRNSIAAAGAQAQATAADLATAQLSLQAELASNYVNLRGLDAQAQLLATTVDAYQRALKLTQARHNEGIASGLDVDRAQAQLSNAKAQISDVAAQRALYEHAIATLVGQAASSFTLASTSSPRLIPEIPAGLPSTLIQRRPDIAAAERRAFAANRQIGVAKAAFFPTVTLDAQGGYQNTGGPNFLTAPNTFWTIGPELALTLFDGGRRRAVVEASKAGFLVASAKYRATVLLAFQQVEDQLALSAQYAAEAVDEGDAVRATQATSHLSLVRYREGATNYLDVVTAQTAELQAEQTALSLETRRQQASIDLVRALGGGWNSGDLPTLGKSVRLAQH